MDIYDYLKQDHQKVAHLFKQFQKTEDAQYQKEIAKMLVAELTVHALSEEKTFYKELKKHDESEDEAIHAKKEHDELLKLAKTIGKRGKSNQGLTQKIKKLKEMLDHHVREEEGKMFRKAKKVLSEHQAVILKERMHDYKLKLLGEGK